MGNKNTYYNPELKEVTLPEITVMPRGSYIAYTGKETNVPSLEEFTLSKQDEARVQAAHKILNLENPIIPTIPSLSFKSKLYGILGMPDKARIERFGKEKNPLTCITTATSMYPQGCYVTGVLTFWDNPSKYGFEYTENLKEGDLLIFPDKSHSAIITGFNELGEPVLTYSKGGTDSKSMKKDNDNWHHPESDGYLGRSSLGIGYPFRFVGTEEQKKNWEQIYKQLYNK